MTKLCIIKKTKQGIKSYDSSMDSGGTQLEHLIHVPILGASLVLNIHVKNSF